MKAARVDYIDGLRGMAAFAVVLQHIAERLMFHDPAASGYLDAIFSSSVNTGRFGIGLFFLISGFVVPFSFKEPHPVMRFAVSRFFRLYPAYWVSLAAAVLVMTSMADVRFSTWNIVANITMFQTALGQPGVIGPYWTLIIELVFYGMCAVLFALRLLSDWRALLAAWAALLSLSIGLSAYGQMSGHYLSANLPLNMSLMFLGAILRRWTLEGDSNIARWSPAILVFAFASVPVILFLAPARPTLYYTPAGFCIAYWLALGVFLWAAKSKGLRLPVLTFLGTVSYSLYLFHDICLTALENTLPMKGVPAHALFALAAIASSIGVAIIVYYLVERPAVRLGRVTTGKLFAGGPRKDNLSGMAAEAGGAGRNTVMR